MANIIYNQFLKKLTGEGIDLSNSNEYKICLLKENVQADVLKSSYEGDYTLISQSGWECRDSIPPTDDLVGYHLGGKYISLVKNTQSAYTEYFSTDVVFRNVTLENDNAARYALIYRVSDGLLISLFDLGRSVEVNDDSLILNWRNVAVMRLGTVESGGEMYIDSRFSDISENALQNKVLTEAIKRYGVILDDDPQPDDDGDFEPGTFAPLEGMDSMTVATEEDISNIEGWN